MRAGSASLLRSMPVRLALGLVALFSVVSLASLAASYLVTRTSLDQAIRDGLRQDMIGFRAAPNAAAVAALVDAEGRATDPERLVLSYIARNGNQFGNTAVARTGEGYQLVLIGEENSRLKGSYLALSAPLYGGHLTIARSRAEIEALQSVFLNILWLSLLPTVLVALSGGVLLARRSARQVDVIGRSLDRLTMGKLDARVGQTDGWSHDLAQIGQKVDQMARAQEAATSALRQVSTDIAHDLKTPIQRVAVHLDDLLHREPLAPGTRDLAEQAKTELDSIASVFQSLLQIAQIESGSPRSRFQAVDLAGLCQTFFEMYEPAASERGHELHLVIPDEGPFTVHGERHLLGQLLVNLIENAMTHTPAGCAITIDLSRAGNRIGLGVSDTGPGIPEAKRALVLKRLYRLDRSRTTPGNGLGLSFVRVVAELHEADLTLADAAPGLRVALSFAQADQISRA